MITWTHLKEAWRIYKRSIKVKIRGIKKYKGDADEICRQAVKACWNGKYFQVSAGHFSEFYMRDFGWSVDSLLKIGYGQEVRKTLEYVMNVYSICLVRTTPWGVNTDEISFFGGINRINTDKI